MNIDPKRQELLAVLKKLVDRGVTDPFDCFYDSADAEGEAAGKAYDEWFGQDIPDTTPDDYIRESISRNTLLYDVGFTDRTLLEDISGEWLINVLADAESYYRRDLAMLVQKKINEIEHATKNLYPDAEITDFSSYESEWNPPRVGGPEAFYPPYAYWKGPGNVTIDGAVEEYMRLHPDEDNASVKKGMEDAVNTYKETA